MVIIFAVDIATRSLTRVVKILGSYSRLLVEIILIIIIMVLRILAVEGVSESYMVFVAFGGVQKIV